MQWQFGMSGVRPRTEALVELVFGEDDQYGYFGGGGGGGDDEYDSGGDENGGDGLTMQNKAKAG